MAQSREHKAQTRERILAQASERLRADGLAGVSIAQLMTAAGVTHGGFYRHFDSREDLIAQATERALREGAAAGARARAGQPPTLAAYVKSYLSRTHRDAPERGCAIAALAADVPHAGAPTAEVFTAGLLATLERLTAQFAARAETGSGTLTADVEGAASRASPAPAPMDDAIALLSTMVGALVLSRAVNDAELSDRVLAVNRTRLIDDMNQSTT
ncbi:MAG: TetR/AcrR family transcriptional regulator [Comamonadaceae bacterium]|nr:MAG: TetR/AcrR family transcriptional regulator [Comamonadaceae bacterium]